MEHQNHSSFIISYITLRRAIGILGISLPFVMIAGSVIANDCSEIQYSVSLYYHTIMRNVFVGILCAVALFMFAYTGYDIYDRIAGILAFVFVLGVAFFPTVPDPDEIISGCTVEPFRLNRLVGIIHFVSASLFFLVLSFISIFLFTRTKDNDKNNYTPEKKKRNILYRICGFIMIGSLALIALWFLLIKQKYPFIHELRPVFWLETIALIAFGISWLTKGELIWKDQPIK
jgi:hypothetical protein